LNDYFFLDSKPSDVELDATQADVIGWALIRGHLILRVDELDSKLKLTVGEPDWLNEYLRQNPKALADFKQGANVEFITASTQDLQQFVLAHLGKNELFGEPGFSCTDLQALVTRKGEHYASHSGFFSSNALISAAAIARLRGHREPTSGGGSEISHSAIHS
jgi:Rps23 Pro-64 3,4-dihydroxylase Tpa1-like proline 4-hydroxylase